MRFIIFVVIFIIVLMLRRKKNEDTRRKNGAPKDAPQDISREAPPGTARRNMPESSQEEYGRKEAPERTRAIFDGEGYDSGAVYDGVRKRK